MARQVAKFNKVTPFNLKVIGANTLNYKPILTPTLKLLRKPLFSVGYRLARLGYFATRVKISERSTR